MTGDYLKYCFFQVVDKSTSVVFVASIQRQQNFVVV